MHPAYALLQHKLFPTTDRARRRCPGIQLPKGANHDRQHQRVLERLQPSRTLYTNQQGKSSLATAPGLTEGQNNRTVGLLQLRQNKRRVHAIGMPLPPRCTFSQTTAKPGDTRGVETGLDLF